MLVRCLHCHEQIQLADESDFSHISCSSCGGNFSLIGDGTVSYAGEVARKLGRFELIEQVGIGAFGTVWKAHDSELDRTVAIKIPRKEHLDSGETDQFLREARAAAQLQHSNIVSVHEVGREEDTVYIVSDFVQGATLDGWLTGQRLTVREATTLCAKLADALHHAHEAGVIHRDLKPGNIMIGLDGEPHLMDFGMARRQRVDVTMTIEGRILGTPAYMSPEQARGAAHHADRRTDIYSLGVILFRLLTGELPYRGSRDMLIVQVLRDEPPSPRKFDSRIPRDLETITLKCLEKNPDRRYQTAADVAADLRRWMKREPLLARPISRTERAWRWCRRNPMVATLLGCIAILLGTVAMVSSVAALWLRTERNTALQNLHRAEQAEHDAREKLWTSYLARARAGRWSGRAGRRFESLEALANAAKIRPTLELRNEAIACMPLVDLRVAKQWETPPGTVASAFDAKLERYARAADHGNISIRQVANDQELVSLAGSGLWAHLVQFSPDGRFLAALYHHYSPAQLWVWDLGRGEVLFKLTPQSTDNEGFDFTPDSRQFAAGTEDGTIGLYELPSGRQLKRLSAGLAPNRMRFHPDGRKLAVCHRQDSTVQILDVDSGNVISTLVHPAGVRGVSWRADGGLLAAACADFQVYVWTPGTGERHAVLSGHQAEAVGIAFNHLGDILASTSWDVTTRLWDPMNGRQLVSVLGRGYMQFSPDDRLLAFYDGSREVGCKVGLWEVATGRERRTLYGHVGGKGPHRVDVSPDGRLIASASGDGVRVWDLATGRHVAHLPTSAISVIFHPDGKSLVVPSGTDLHRWPIQTEPDSRGLRIGPPQRLNVNLSSDEKRLSITPDGRYLAVSDRGFGQVIVLDLANMAEKAAFKDIRELANVAISPDGDWVVSSCWPTPSVKVWNVHTGQFVKDLPVKRVAHIAFKPDGKWLVTSTIEGCSFWEVGSWQTGQQMATSGGAFFSRDGKVLAIGGEDRLVRLIDPQTGREFATLEAPDPQPHSWLCFSPNGTRLVAACGTRVVEVWDLRLIRQQLAAIGLDWDLPPYPTANEVTPAAPLQMTVDLGDVPQSASQEFDAQARQAATHARRARQHANAKQWNEAIAEYSKALELNPKHALRHNNLAWLLATCPDKNLRDAARSLEHAKQSVELGPSDPVTWNTLGVAHYRAGSWPSAIEALTKAEALGPHQYFSFDAFFLAMAHWQMGEKDQARKWFAQAVEWMETNQPTNEELRQFRAEAATLLGLSDQPTLKKNSD